MNMQKYCPAIYSWLASMTVDDCEAEVKGKVAWILNANFMSFKSFSYSYDVYKKNFNDFIKMDSN